METLENRVADEINVNKRMVSIEIERLLPHPENPNKMSKSNFTKLCMHIESNGNYEPVVVRKHPERQDVFEIVNGHHRTEALRKLGHEKVDCVVWDVDDDQVRILLATLNRLGGRDILEKKAALVQKLSEKFEAKQLAGLLTDSGRQIEKLKGLRSVSLKSQGKIANEESLQQVCAVVFFATPSQKEVVENAVRQRVQEMDAKRGRESRTIAIVDICKNYLDGLKKEES